MRGQGWSEGCGVTSSGLGLFPTETAGVSLPPVSLLLLHAQPGTGTYMGLVTVVCPGWPGRWWSCRVGEVSWEAVPCRAPHGLDVDAAGGRAGVNRALGADSEGSSPVCRALLGQSGRVAGAISGWGSADSVCMRLGLSCIRACPQVS